MCKHFNLHINININEIPRGNMIKIAMKDKFDIFNNFHWRFENKRSV